MSNEFDLSAASQPEPSNSTNRSGLTRRRLLTGVMATASLGVIDQVASVKGKPIQLPSRRPVPPEIIGPLLVPPIEALFRVDGTDIVATAGSADVPRGGTIPLIGAGTEHDMVEVYEFLFNDAGVARQQANNGESRGVIEMHDGTGEPPGQFWIQTNNDRTLNLTVIDPRSCETTDSRFEPLIQPTQSLRRFRGSVRLAFVYWRHGASTVLAYSRAEGMRDILLGAWKSSPPVTSFSFSVSGRDENSPELRLRGYSWTQQSGVLEALNGADKTPLGLPSLRSARPDQISHIGAALDRALPAPRQRELA